MLAFKSATELVQMLRDRQLSARELFAEYGARADRYNAKLNAIIWTDPAAETTARNADAGSLLAGLPMTVKESFDVTGAPTTWGIP